MYSKTSTDILTFDTTDAQTERPYSGLRVSDYSDDSDHSDHSDHSDSSDYSDHSDYSDYSDHSDSSDYSDHSDSSDYSSPLISKFPNLHVGISKSSRGEETFSTWRRNKTSEESNETSEEMFRPYVENQK